MKELEANAILTFRDDKGREWLAAAVIGNLVRSKAPGKDEADELLDPIALRDQPGFRMTRLTMVIR